MRRQPVPALKVPTPAYGDFVLSLKA